MTMHAARPIKIVYLDGQDDQFKIDLEAITSILNKVGDHPFILYSVNGRTRGGKSYLLNHFIRFLDYKAEKRSSSGNWFTNPLPKNGGFPTDNTLDRVTTGINMWSEPFFDIRNGKKVAILLMDCQGLFDDETTLVQNALLFSFSNLLSSVMVYNLSGHIDEASLQQLDLYSEYAKAVGGHDTENSHGGQKLVLLIRDFQAVRDFALGYHDEVECPDGNKNLFLSSMVNGPKILADNLKVRENIRQNFSSVGVFLLPYPGSSFLQNPEISPDAPFVENVKKFVTLMNSDRMSITKTICGEEVTGTKFKLYLESWVKTYEKDYVTNLPEVKDIRTATILVQNGLAMGSEVGLVDKKLDAYLNSQGGGFVSDADLQKEFQLTMVQSKHRLKSTKKFFGDPATQNQYMMQFESKCEEIYKKYHQKNAEVRQKVEEAAAQKREIERVENEKRKREAEKQKLEEEKRRRDVQLAEETRKRLEALKIQQQKNEQEKREREAELLRIKVEQERREAERNRRLEEIRQAGLKADRDRKRGLLAGVGIFTKDYFEWNGTIRVVGDTTFVSDTATLFKYVEKLQVGGIPGVQNLTLE